MIPLFLFVQPFLTFFTIIHMFACTLKKKKQPLHGGHKKSKIMPAVSTSPRNNVASMSVKAADNQRSNSARKKTMNKKKVIQDVIATSKAAAKEEPNKKMLRQKRIKIANDDYPEIAEPTTSARKKREKELEEDKRIKIQKGFYQSRSDEDDTLEPIKSLKEEDTEDEANKSSKKVLKAQKNK